LSDSKYPLFSVLVANYNRAPYLKEALESILSQDYPNFEVVLVDDGSTDGSAAIIQKLTGVEPKIKYFQSPVNEGCGAAMRKCVDLASGAFMALCGSDDFLMPTAITSHAEAHRLHPDCSIIYSTHYVCDESLNIQRLSYGAMVIPQNESYLSFGKGITSLASFSRDHYNLTDGIDAKFKRAVDQDFYYKLEEVGKVLFIDKPLYKYRVNRSGISTSKNISKARYWFALAKEEAYQRRLINPSVKNISRGELNAWWSVVFITKSSEKFRQGKICAGFFWLGKSFGKSIFDRYSILKVKSIFLNSYPHWVLKKLKRTWKKKPY
jgi:glycosyltransferase involved in cell wall biosynthesis